MLLPGRLSVCYLAPGCDFRPGSSHSREVLTLARALAREADVTVAFRRAPADASADGVSVVALEPGPVPSGDAAPSRRALGRFVERRATGFGLVLEGTWSMPGKVTTWCAQRGIPAIPVIDRLPPASWLGPLDTGSVWLGLGASGRYLRRAPAVVTGSAELRDTIVQRWRLDPDRIVALGPAIDRTVLAPGNQDEARRRLGLPLDHRILLAGDGLGHGADLAPLLQAVQRAGDPSLRVHVFGDGERRAALERLAGPGGAITFHGLVPDDLLATYLAAADLCVSVGESGDPGFTIPEALSCARPVAVATTRDRLSFPVRHNVTGFVIEHDLLAWIRFLQRDCPSRNTLRMMGLAAGSTPFEHVDRIAVAYGLLMERVRAGAAHRVTAM
jgi:hypothetical protein